METQQKFNNRSDQTFTSLLQPEKECMVVSFMRDSVVHPKKIPAFGQTLGPLRFPGRHYGWSKMIERNSSCHIGFTDLVEVDGLDFVHGFLEVLFCV